MGEDEYCWVRVVGPDGVLEEGSVPGHEVATDWKQDVRAKYDVRPLRLEERDGGQWLELTTIDY